MHYGERRDQTELKRLVENNHLTLNNEPGKATRPVQRTTTSCIELAFTTTDIRALDTKVIGEELRTPLDYEVIVCGLAGLNGITSSMCNSQKGRHGEYPKNI